MSTTGKVLAVLRSEECAVVDPINGGPTLYIHADEFGMDWNSLTPGMTVRFSSLQGARGPRAYNVIVLNSSYSSEAEDVDVPGSGLNDVTRPNYEDLIASVLISTVPEINGEQVSAVCKRLTECGAFR
jgi:cold shock CspA family protein